MQNNQEPSLEAQEIAVKKLQEKEHFKTASPTISGGQVGSNMNGGGQLGNPEITDDKLGNLGLTGPIILDASTKKKSSSPPQK